MVFLLEATGEKTKSKALDRAAEFYLQMRGDTAAVPSGAFIELMEKVEQQGSVTAEEIAEILHTDELPVEVQMSWSVEIID
ncbi:hypothetical protein [Haladaptatus sp. DYF46]|uniref:hypothetical protein n=1 Tax=Haladaptatus sp. DYF46 TaxID=2886041 RepID=UPI001E5FEE54|nr:hypothetical protein [Haladaptatus sp. DYF46]